MKFTSEHDEFRRSVRSLLEREFSPHIDDWEADGVMPLHDVFATGSCPRSQTRHLASLVSGCKVVI